MHTPRNASTHRGNRRGATLIFVAALMTVLVGMGAVGVDFARMYAFKAQLQASADAGAMAGAVELMRARPTTALGKAKTYAMSNRVDGTAIPAVADSQVRPCHWDFSNPGVPPCDAQTLAWTDPTVNAIQVRSRYQANYLLGRALGHTTLNLAAVSVAALGSSTTSGKCIKPWAVPLSNLKVSLGKPATDTSALTTSDITSLISNRTTILFKTSPFGASDSNVVGSVRIAGNYYAVAFPPLMDKNNVLYTSYTPAYPSPQVGANNYKDAIWNSCASPYPVRIGDWLQTQPGDMVGPTKAGVDSLCSVRGNPNYAACTPPLPIEVPIYGQAANKSGSSAVQVRYIGEFTLTGRYKDGRVEGYLTAMKTSGGGGFSGTPGPVIMAALVK